MAFRSDRDALLARIAALEAKLQEAHGDREELARQLDEAQRELSAPAERPSERPSDGRGLRVTLALLGVFAAVVVPLIFWTLRTTVEGTITIDARGAVPFETCAHVHDPRDPFRAIDLATADGTRVRLLHGPIDAEVTAANPARRWELSHSATCQAEREVTLEDETTDEYRGMASFDCTVGDGSRIRITAEFRHCD